MTDWEKEIKLPGKDSDIEYAYITKSDTAPVICDKETLFQSIQDNEDIIFVSTPDTKSFIVLGTNYETLIPILKKQKEAIRSSIKRALLFIVLVVGLLWLLQVNSKSEEWLDSLAKFYLLAFGVIPILSGLYDILNLRKITEANYQAEALEIKFGFWIGQKKVISIYIVTGTLTVIAIIQFLIGWGESVGLAGLVKSKTLEGEYWRLLTATLLHASIMHILFNAAAIYTIGHMLIRITGFFYFPIVFLISGITGSIFSLYLLPEVTSVGASGGIMGLIGFILVLSIKLKSIPRNLIKSILISIILVMIIGFSATEIIDNAAHIGGLIAGLILGILLIRKRDNMVPYKSSGWIKTLGTLCLLILISGIGLLLKLFML
jgi:membrane associated rhomboid family serine protease